MEWLLNPIGDLLVWTFGILECLGDKDWVSNIIILGGFVGLGVWMKMQLSYNKKAANDPDQIQ